MKRLCLPNRDIHVGLIAGVTGRQGILTPPGQLISLLVRVCPPFKSVVLIGIIRWIAFIYYKGEIVGWF